MKTPASAFARCAATSAPRRYALLVPARTFTKWATFAYAPGCGVDDLVFRAFQRGDDPDRLSYLDAELGLEREAENDSEEEGAEPSASALGRAPKESK